MRIKRAIAVLVAAFFLTFTSPAVNAQQFGQPGPNHWTGFYLGINGGLYSQDWDTGWFSSSSERGSFGLHAGYDYQFGGLVIGGVADVSWLGGYDDIAMVTLRGRLGYDFGGAMLYATAGTAGTVGDVVSDFDQFIYGAGVAFKFAPNVSMSAEWLQMQDDSNGDWTVNWFRVGATYHFR